jgi:putative copper export protein
MIVIALINRYFLLPRSWTESAAAAQMIRRNTIGETALGLGVLAVVSVLGTLEPV